MTEVGRFLSRSSGRHQGQSRGRTRRGSRKALSTVRARVGGVPAQLGGDEGIGARARVHRQNLLGGQRGEKLASAISGARAALPGEAVLEGRGKGRVDAHRVLPRSGYFPTRALEAARRRESGSTARPREAPLEREASKLLAQIRGK